MNNPLVSRCLLAASLRSFCSNFAAHFPLSSKLSQPINRVAPYAKIADSLAPECTKIIYEFIHSRRIKVRIFGRRPCSRHGGNAIFSVVLFETSENCTISSGDVRTKKSNFLFLRIWGLSARRWRGGDVNGIIKSRMGGSGSAEFAIIGLSF